MSAPSSTQEPFNEPGENLPLKQLAAEMSGALETGDSVEAAGDTMREHSAEVWPRAEGRDLPGVVEGENPDRKLGGHGHDPKDWCVGQIMNREFVFCFEDESCATARALMVDRGMRHLPVVDRHMRIVGIVSREEIEQEIASDASTTGKSAKP